MQSVSVSNLDLFRLWKDDEELSLGWLLQRIFEPSQTDAMKAGEAFHKALELADTGEVDSLTWGPYRFDFACDVTVALPQLREIPVSLPYGDLTVRGRLDAITGHCVTDFKTTEQFDADRLMSGFQWRYYLDMTGCDVFRWLVFVLREQEIKCSCPPYYADKTDYTGDFCPRHGLPEHRAPEHVYQVADFHELVQRRYPDLHKDCERLAREYAAFAVEHLKKPEKTELEIALEQSLAKCEEFEKQKAAK